MWCLTYSSSANVPNTHDYHCFNYKFIQKPNSWVDSVVEGRSVDGLGWKNRSRFWKLRTLLHQGCPVQVKGFRWGPLKSNLSGSGVCSLQNRIHNWFSVFLLWLSSFSDCWVLDDFSGGQRWSEGIRIMTCRREGSMNNGFLPKKENSTEPTFDGLTRKLILSTEKLTMMHFTEPR